MDLGVHGADEDGVLAGREECQGHESQDGGKAAHSFIVAGSREKARTQEKIAITPRLKLLS